MKAKTLTLTVEVRGTGEHSEVYISADSQGANGFAYFIAAVAMIDLLVKESGVSRDEILEDLADGQFTFVSKMEPQ